MNPFRKTSTNGGISRTAQNSLMQLNAQNNESVCIQIGEVIKSHTDRMACDILSNGVETTNVPVLSMSGLIDGKVWGSVELPSVGTYVLIAFVGFGPHRPFILGTLMPYLNSLYQTNQEPVNSADKAFTKKLLEASLDYVFRKVFQSGTSFEVKPDGTMVLETPSGKTIQIDEAGNAIKILDEEGRGVTIDVAGAKINILDKNGKGVVIDEASGKTTINGNLEVAT